MADRFDRCACARLLGMVVVATWPGGARVVMEGLVQKCFLGKKGFPPNHIVTISPVMGSMMTDI
jgi:hypothetical protein